ncbi:hypothetical protein [uncultured Campylobacter sp.]|uniref:hypothetical protein n=1 Tax=uncultured Campylobacter sp. TaxID=218934 RepID=UPI00262BECA2|nr:hypothetical protein [uncultured Campylobacter sp.]
MKTIEPANLQWLTTKQLQEQYGFSLTHQSKLRMKKNYTKEAASKIPPIPFSKIGKTILYYKADIEEWLQKLKVSPARK